MLSTLWKVLGRHTLCGAAVLLAANLVQAQGTALPPLPPPLILPALAQDAPKNQPISQIQLKDAPAAQLGVPAANTAAPTIGAPVTNNSDKARIDQLEKQIQDLTNAIKSQPRPVSAPVDASQPGLSAKDVQQLINGYFAEKENEKQAAAKVKSDQGYKVGTDLDMKVSWQNGVVFETPNKDFWVRMGFRFQYDDVFWGQGTSIQKKAPVGIGEDVDANYFRRVRPNWQGGFWEVGEFNVEIKLETITNGIAGMDDVWVGVKDIPLLGTVRVGHFHLLHGLEADMYSSSKPMTFFEVASSNNAFYSGERTGSGLWLTNSFLNDRMTYGANFYRPDSASNGDQFADGDYAAIGRLTFLPIYSNDGRCLLHLGGSLTYRHAINGVVDFGSTPGMLDNAGGDNGYGATPTATVNGTSTATGAVTASPTVLTSVKGASSKLSATLAGLASSPGDNSKIIDSGNMMANASTIFSPELLYIQGPFSLQGEYSWAVADGATAVAANGLNGQAAKIFGRQNICFTGGYIQASYFLTGENRTYDKRLGRLGSEYITRANTPFWLVRDKNGTMNYGLGAWELAARFSRLDLNAGPIQGGVMDQVEAGVNWHLNNNLRVQFMYLHTERYDLPSTSEGGWQNGFGIRTQFTF